MGRIEKEIREMKKNEPYYAEPDENDTSQWNGYVLGPEDTVYEGGKFLLTIVLPSDYPFSAPTVQFKTPVYHPNISESGAVCIDILKDQWSPALTLHAVLVSITSLLSDPNPDDPLVTTIAHQYIHNRKEFYKSARENTQKYAIVKENILTQ